MDTDKVSLKRLDQKNESLLKVATDEMNCKAELLPLTQTEQTVEMGSVNAVRNSFQHLEEDKKMKSSWCVAYGDYYMFITEQ